MLSVGGTDVVNGQLIAGPFGGVYNPPPAVGPTIRGAGGNMGLPTLPYLTANQTGGAPGQGGRVLSTSSILVLGLGLALSVLLMYHIHWS